jgi:hypothetical protein
MPSALLKACPGDGGTCPELVASGHCAKHQRLLEQRRGTATARGYDSYWSKVFRPRFMRLLIAAGVAPVCGAALPGGPAMTSSTCRANGLLNDRHLHLDHNPPLRPEERAHRHLVCDPLRVGLLCEADHARKTQREQQQGVI